MFSVKAEQHSKILGFALIAYGLQLLFDIAGALNGLFKVFDSDSGIPFWAYLTLYFDSTLLPLWAFFISIVSGLAILLSKKSIKFLSLLFVFRTFSYFPLVTILSFYVLWYLFVISQNEVQTKDNLSKEIK